MASYLALKDDCFNILLFLPMGSETECVNQYFLLRWCFKSILTRDVLLHIGGMCEEKCLLCGDDKSIDHFFCFPLAKYICNTDSCTSVLAVSEV
jgi:hypothetical protein